jgi:hypothetical protein
VPNEEAVNVLKEIRVRIDEANREYDDMGAIEQMRHGEEVWATCIQDVRSMVSTALGSE